VWATEIRRSLQRGWPHLPSSARLSSSHSDCFIEPAKNPRRQPHASLLQGSVVKRRGGVSNFVLVEVAGTAAWTKPKEKRRYKKPESTFKQPETSQERQHLTEIVEKAHSCPPDIVAYPKGRPIAWEETTRGILS
jgi:hypothetical protein